MQKRRYRRKRDRISRFDVACDPIFLGQPQYHQCGEKGDENEKPEPMHEWN